MAYQRINSRQGKLLRKNFWMRLLAIGQTPWPPVKPHVCSAHLPALTRRSFCWVVVGTCGRRRCWIWATTKIPTLCVFLWCRKKYKIVTQHPHARDDKIVTFKWCDMWEARISAFDFLICSDILLFHKTKYHAQTFDTFRLQLKIVSPSSSVFLNSRSVCRGMFATLRWTCKTTFSYLSNDTQSCFITF